MIAIFIILHSMYLDIPLCLFDLDLVLHGQVHPLGRVHPRLGALVGHEPLVIVVLHKEERNFIS